jgi:hypothetical protein
MATHRSETAQCLKLMSGAIVCLSSLRQKLGGTRPLPSAIIPVLREMAILGSWLAEIDRAREQWRRYEEEQ